VVLSVNTQPPINISNTTASLKGSLTSLSSAANASVYFQWGTTTAYSNNTTQIPVNATGDFLFAFVNLTPNSTYHYRAVATAGSTTVYGNDLTLVTTYTPPAGQIIRDLTVQEAYRMYTANVGKSDFFILDCRNVFTEEHLPVVTMGKSPT